MCKCTPNIRTPFCGKGDCVWPDSKPEGVRETNPSAPFEQWFRANFDWADANSSVDELHEVAEAWAERELDARVAPLVEENARLKAENERIEFDTECPHCEEVVTVTARSVAPLRRERDRLAADVERLKAEARELCSENERLSTVSKERRENLAALRKEIEDAPTVYGCQLQKNNPNSWVWCSYSSPAKDDTHRAKLVRIEKLEEKRT